MLESLIVRALTILAGKVLSEKLFAALIVRGLRSFCHSTDSVSLCHLANDVAVTLGRPDLVEPVVHADAATKGAVEAGEGMVWHSGQGWGPKRDTEKSTKEKAP